MKPSKVMIAMCASTLAVAAVASDYDRPQGFKIGDRLTLKPYVSLSFTYDSNVDSTKKSKKGSNWTVNPGVGLVYAGDNWSLQGTAWYTYHAYNNYSSQLNQSSYGERLLFSWADSKTDEKGWTVKINERFQQISQDDDMSEHNGRGVGRDRKEFSAEGIIERRLNRNIHLAVTGSYYMLDYDNDVKKYAPMYGWERATVGGEVGYMASNWTDFIVSGDYMWYDQDNNRLRSSSLYDSVDAKGKKIHSHSTGWSLMGGIATRATERIDYRLLGGYSRFDYGSGTKDLGGFTYQASASWRIHDRTKFMLLGSSYYQPSETGYGSAKKIYTLSAGLAHSFIRGKLTGNLDMAYRKQCTEYAEYETDNYDEDIWTSRVGLNYNLNRFFTFFARLEYQFTDSERRAYEYDRWRGTVGVRISY